MLKKHLIALLLLANVAFASNNLTTSDNGKTFIKEREGFSEVAYYDGTWTIGFGNTFYPDNRKVKRGDRITREQGNQILDHVLKVAFEPQVNSLVKTDLNQSQFDALVSYAYNRGNAKLGSSTLLRIINLNPNDGRIKEQFVKEWGTNQQFKNGLIRRRKQEAELYFSELVLVNTPDKIPVYEPKQKPASKWKIYLIFLIASATILYYLFGIRYKLTLKITKVP